ncbi:hypothetical protein A0H81_07111, partial [Grifola frondosa]
GLQSHLMQKLSCRNALREAMERKHHTAALNTAASESLGDELDFDVFSNIIKETSDSPHTHPHPLSSAAASETTSRRVRVEEWRTMKPGACQGGLGLGIFLLRLHIKTTFENIQDQKREADESSWTPFACKEEWELANWLMSTVLSQNAIEDYLTLPIEVELWKHDPIECVRELIGNPVFKDLMHYVPEKQYSDRDGEERIYDEMWTADWWWDTQVSNTGSNNVREQVKLTTYGPELLPMDATIAPVILSSDKMQLSQFSGDKQAWPVYLSIGNIEKSTRRQPSKHATILVGYIPVTKLEYFSSSRRSLEGYRLFHSCMQSILDPLIEAGCSGMEMTCADGCIRRVHPILAAYIADHPEQCLVSGCQENCCPKCTVPPTKLGEAIYSVMKEPGDIQRIIAEAARGERPVEFKQYGLRLVDPFWSHLPHCDIFTCITPDLLHQLHKGVFKDHTVSWATGCIGGGATEVDNRFKAMPSHPTLRHFKKGISLVSQWTGTEYKNMEKVFLGVLTGASDPAVLRAVRAVLDFIYFAHFETHSDNSLSRLNDAWTDFHANKHVFIEHGIRDHFNIPKFHSTCHYESSIRRLGTADGYNTEGSERLHIDYAKRAYASSNKKVYVQQMTTWLTRQEAVHRFNAYLQWAEPRTSHSLRPNESSGHRDVDDEDAVVDNDADESDHLGAQQPVSTYLVAKEPGLPNTPVHSLQEDFGCVDFMHTLERFLRHSSGTQALPPAAQNITSATRFSVYKRVTVHLPALYQVSSVQTKDTIRAMPKQAPCGLCKAVPAHFDTVLAYELPGDNREHLLDGLCVARVQAIFRIPDSYGACAEHPLAYVEWFTPFRTPVPDIGMYKISQSFRNHRRRTSIIPVTQIKRSCHLLPVWGKKMEHSWTSENVLDECKHFYVNPYL